jgi:hypothetical protein
MLELSAIFVNIAADCEQRPHATRQQNAERLDSLLSTNAKLVAFCCKIGQGR